MTLHVGIIAEDVSDVAVIKELLNHYTLPKLVVRYFVGKGCGKIKGKARAWASNLSTQGCSRLIIVHDSDANDKEQLLRDIRVALDPSPIRLHVISIPVREIEAWLLADHNAIKVGLKIRGSVKKVANPEAIQRPKEFLEELVRKTSGKTISYVNTVHNRVIAAECSLEALRRCNSFHVFDQFVRNSIR